MSTPEARITLAIDAMGGDEGSEEILEGLALAVEDAPRSARFVVVGREEELLPNIERNPLLCAANVEMLHASEVIGMNEKPIAGIKKKKDSSMARALELVKEDEADALFSCGNTGCLMAGGAIRLRTLDGVERPALCTIWPGRERYFTLLDAGANPHKSELIKKSVSEHVNIFLQPNLSDILLPSIVTLTYPMAKIEIIQ